MGEAKYRKIHDPLYGIEPKSKGQSGSQSAAPGVDRTRGSHPPANVRALETLPELPKLADHERGLIVSVPIRGNAKGDIFIRESTLHAEELRFSLLFWDKLVWPSSSLVYFEGGNDESFLEQAGVLSRAFYDKPVWSLETISETQFQAFEQCEATSPGKWAMARGENSFNVKLSKAEIESESATVELLRAIPIPAHDVPLNEILEFRNRRRDELGVLRGAIETLRTRLENAADPASEMAAITAEIDQACAAVIRVGSEWQFPIAFGSWKIGYSVTADKIYEASASAAVAHFGGLPLTSAALVGVARLAMSSIQLGRGLELRSSRPPSVYRYAYHLDRELA